ncbi:MAG: O-antigen ligase family protein, partial [Bacteriovoracaceae bacterium]|nr:O-antigen ligase family protein [Bacteriovoracaceae bacterium]
VGLIVGVYATFQFFGMDFFKWVKRPYDKVPSMAGNANLCGNILALLFPIGLYFIFKAKNRALKILSILSTVFILLGVLFSQSRAIWLTVLVTVVFIIFVTLIIHREIIARHKKLYIISIACVLSITHFLVNSFIIMRYSNTLFLIISLMGHALIFSIWNMQERWTKIKIKFSSIIYLIILLCTFALSLTIKIQYSAPETFGHKYFSTFHFEKIPRYFLFRDSTYVIKDHFFFGTGEGTYRIAYMPYKSIENEIAEPKANYDSPHNNYLTVWATQGVFAFIAYMSIIFIFFRGAFKTISSTTVNRDDKLLMGTLLASFFAYLLWSLTSFDSNVTNPIMIGLFASFSVLLYLIRRDEITVESKYASKIIMVCKGFMILLIPLAILSIITVQKLYNADQHYAKTVRFKNTAIKYLNKKEKEKAVKIMSMARREANKAISMNPRESFYHVEMADIHFNLFKLTGAKHHIQETYKFLKNSREHDWDPGKYYLVKMKLELSQGNKNEAIRYAESVLKDLPYNFIVRSQLGYLLFQRRTAKAFKKALEHFRITLRIKPNNLVSLVYTSEIYLRFGKFNLARQFANKAMVAHPSRKKQLIGLLQKINKSEEQLKKSAKNKS